MATTSTPYLQRSYYDPNANQFPSPQPWQAPIPAPTPYRAPQYGGNPLVIPGTVGQHIPGSALGTYNENTQTTTFGTGQTTPPGATYSQPPTNTQQYGGVDQGNLMDRFPGYAGWDLIPAWQDYLATGGSGKEGGGGTPSTPAPAVAPTPAPPAPTTYQNPYSPGKSITTTGPAPTKGEQFAEAYPETDISAFLDKYANPDEFYSEIENVYGKQSELLNQAEEAIRTGQTDILLGIEKDMIAAQALAKGGKEGGLEQLGQSERVATGRKEDALAAARRLYSELQQGGRQKFGGATSAGGAYSELLGVEQQRQMGQTGRDFGEAMQQIQTQKVDVERTYQQQLQQLEADKQNSMNQATQEFQNRLLQITQSRVETEEGKSQARLGVLQNLRDQASQIQQQQTQFRQQLEMMKQQQLMDLDNYAQKINMSAGVGAGATSGFMGQTSVTPTTTTRIPGQAGSLGTGIESARGQIAGFNQRDFEEKYGLSPVQAYTRSQY